MEEKVHHHLTKVTLVRVTGKLWQQDAAAAVGESGSEIQLGIKFRSFDDFLQMLPNIPFSFGVDKCSLWENETRASKLLSIVYIKRREIKLGHL
jgi:hypothetical protein